MVFIPKTLASKEDIILTFSFSQVHKKLPKMFLKPYKIKSTTTLKNTEKKLLVQRLQDAFPQANSEELKELVPAKCSCSCLKLVVHSGETVALFAVDGEPLAVDTEQGLLPALPAVWKLPHLLPRITIHTPVLPKLVGGAPLYLPGVVMPSGGVGFPMFVSGALLAVGTSDNAAAGCIGRALINSADMLMRIGGSCLDIIFIYGDLLTREPRLGKVARPMQSVDQLIPVDRLADSVTQLSIAPPREQWPALGPRAPPAMPAPDAVPGATTPADAPPECNGEHNDSAMDDPSSATPLNKESAIPTDMDGLLRYCLLSFIKLRAKHVDLPLKVNLLYKNHLMELCPSGAGAGTGRSLDVKQSSYKKIGKFLDAMQQEGLVEVRETDKGVWDVTAVNTQHPALRTHRPPALPAAAVADAPPTRAEGGYEAPVVREVFCVTAAVHDLLQTKKGTALSPSEVRKLVTGYVRQHQLDSARGLVIVDALLAKVLNQPEQECVSWDTVMSGVTSRMTPSTQLTHSDGSSQLIKSRLDPISMAVHTRSGNKKVTLVSNLESFGLSPAGLARTAQAACGASCGVTRSPGAKADQLMLQGDQTNFVARLLVEKYGLPKKFLDGADKALNKKK